MRTWPHCHRTEQQVKVGLNRSGSQRYLCQACQRKYTPEPNEQGCSQELRRAAVENYVDGMNFRRIARVLKVSHTSVMNWVKAHTDSLPDQAPLPDQPQEVNERDEVFTFIGQKKRVSIS